MSDAHQPITELLRPDGTGVPSARRSLCRWAESDWQFESAVWHDENTCHLQGALSKPPH